MLSDKKLCRGGGKMIPEYPIAKSIPLHEHYCPQYRTILWRRKVRESLRRGAPKGNHNWIHNLIAESPIEPIRTQTTVKWVRWRPRKNAVYKYIYSHLQPTEVAPNVKKPWLTAGRRVLHTRHSPLFLYVLTTNHIYVILYPRIENPCWGK